MTTRGKSMKRHVWIAGILMMFMFMTAGTKEVLARGTQSDAIHEGVYVDGIDLSGMTVSEAQAVVNSYVSGLGEETLTLKIFDNELQVALQDLGLSCTNLDVIQEAAQLGKTGNIIRRYKERKDLEYENKNYDLEWTLDSTLVSEYVNSKCIQFDQDATDATLKRSGSSFEIIEGKTGIKLDTDGAVQTITEYIENEWDKENGSVELPVETDYPRGTEEELSRVKDVLGTFTTSYSTSGAGRSQNVANGTSLINGTVLYPGDTFSTYETVSPFSAENGYEMAGSYLNGKVVDSLGGGICQVSTTLYNAVLRAELEVVERSNHSMIVTYVDPSADAAIAGTYKDFKFTNNTDAPIYIEGTTANKQVTFTIYGEETRPSNRTVKYVSQTLSTTDPGVLIVADAGQPIGYRTVESAHKGVVAELYKHVYVNGVEESVTKVNKSTYKASPRTITIGVAGDAELSAQLQAAVATQDEAVVNATLAACLGQ
jgi:vancomycin resistance protein YoaR